METTERQTLEQAAAWLYDEGVYAADLDEGKRSREWEKRGDALGRDEAVAEFLRRVGSEA